MKFEFPSLENQILKPWKSNFRALKIFKKICMERHYKMIGRIIIVKHGNKCYVYK